jgi:hypothetical protein
LVASVAVSSALRFPPATILMMHEARTTRKAGTGCLSMPNSKNPRNETSSSVFHDTSASQLKKAHHITTTPSRISRSDCAVDGRALVPLLPRSAASALPGLLGSVFMRWPLVACLSRGQITGGGRPSLACDDRMRSGGGEMQETRDIPPHALTPASRSQGPEHGGLSRLHVSVCLLPPRRSFDGRGAKFCVRRDAVNFFGQH